MAADPDRMRIVIANGEIRPYEDVDGVTASRLTEPPAADGALAELNAALLKDGLSPAAALREAQDYIRRQPQWQAPFSFL